ncbi:MAG: alpha/beta hydrolase [Muricauda sp.]|nr:alpha/beta fold hydrolase [Allomuricauda sp.]MAU26013.1 alpha/beta hydrolase [Allomuricauda sp.]MBC29782.1 alpha/beta hydrolase [Allomuricauda sp.]|tara:strand:+ start:61777 stop:62706 length:930 start_codon:yes stop_codon:yes gene_type:complete
MKKLFYIFWLSAFSCLGQEIAVEELELYNDSIYLPGTLSYPIQTKKPPLAIFVHGSGNPDRNGNQGEMVRANYIQELADSLNARGIAFYRYDKRNATPANLAKSKNIRIGNLVADLKVAINRFKDDERFASLHLIGHSQGSLVGMLAASEEIKSYTSLAGLGTPVDKALIRQLGAQNKDVGKIAEKYIEELMETDTILDVNPFLMALFAPQNQKYLKDWMLLDPAEEIAKLSMPVLIINGDADLQVTADDAQQLKKAKPDAELAIIPNMNHVLKSVESWGENQRSYKEVGFPLSSKLVETLAKFVLSNG